MHYSDKDDSVVFDVVWVREVGAGGGVCATFLHACLCIIIPRI